MSFTNWMAFGLPVSLAMLFVSWATLAFWHLRGASGAGSAREVLRRQLDDLGPTSYEQRVVLGAFAALAVLWVTPVDIELGFLSIPGGSGLFGEPPFMGDGTVAIAVAVVLFMIRTGRGPASVPWNGKTPGTFPGRSRISLAGGSHWPEASRHQDWPNGSALV